mmetsp:Transcript_58154/g.115288  ORF Transcript_58154/g.115288 Transcript_58154/m.115288 type:complete len:116 (+) Transcript_58154:736-1083(+)
MAASSQPRGARHAREASSLWAAHRSTTILFSTRPASIAMQDISPTNLVPVPVPLQAAVTLYQQLGPGTAPVALEGPTPPGARRQTACHARRTLMHRRKANLDVQCAQTMQTVPQV